MKKLCFFILAFMIICGNAFGAITYRASNVASDVTDAITITKPAGTVDGDVLIAIINGNGNGLTITSAGWVSIDVVDDASATMEIFYKVASSEGADFTFDMGYELRVSGVISTFTGVDTADVDDTHSSNKNSSTTSHVATGITTGADNIMLIYAAGYDSGSTYTWTPPSGFDEAAESGAAAGTTIAYDIQSSAGASGDKTATLSGAKSGVAFLFGLNPAAAASTRRIMVIQ